MKILIVQFPPASYYLIPFRSECEAPAKSLMWEFVKQFRLSRNTNIRKRIRRPSVSMENCIAEITYCLSATCCNNIYCKDLTSNRVPVKKYYHTCHTSLAKMPIVTY
jgi:hypothetical protein